MQDTPIGVIADPLQSLKVSIDTLTLDPANARKHGTKNLDAIKASLHAFGQRKPIVVQRKGMIVRAGNGTLEAAKALGWSHLAAVIIDEDNATASQFAIADNRTAELAEWDDETLASLLDVMEPADREALAFDEDDMRELMSGLEPSTPDEDEAPPLPEGDPITKEGDLWLLGNHRLLCGDSTNGAAVSRLMDGGKASLVFTDPPYGVSYQSNRRTKSEKFDVLENDDLVLSEWILHAKEHSEGWVFVWTTWKVLGAWTPLVTGFGPITNMVVWSKGCGGIGDLKGTFSTDYEVAIVCNRGAAITGKRIGSVWSFGKDAAASYVHPTQKPVALAAEAVDKTTQKGETVLDLFLGSGTTLIACEQLGRRCYGMEISPAYCDVIVERWENLTGKQAVRGK
jgi:DNA modification methylase